MLEIVPAAPNACAAVLSKRSLQRSVSTHPLTRSSASDLMPLTVAPKSHQPVPTLGSSSTDNLNQSHTTFSLSLFAENTGPLNPLSSAHQPFHPTKALSLARQPIHPTKSLSPPLHTNQAFPFSMAHYSDPNLPSSSLNPQEETDVEKNYLVSFSQEDFEASTEFVVHHLKLLVDKALSSSQYMEAITSYFMAKRKFAEKEEDQERALLALGKRLKLQEGVCSLPSASPSNILNEVENLIFDMGATSGALIEGRLSSVRRFVKVKRQARTRVSAGLDIAQVVPANTEISLPLDPKSGTAVTGQQPQGPL